MALYCLAAIFILSNLFWSWVVYQLLDRLMSRDYTDYVRNKKQLSIKTERPKSPSLDPALIEENQKMIAELEARLL